MTPGSGATAPRLRLLHVIHRLGLAGTEYGVIKVVNGIDRSRFQPAICSLLNALPEAREALAKDVPVFTLERSEGFDVRALLALARIVRRERIDIVHSHNWTTYLYAVVAAKLGGARVIIHGEHGRETAEVSHNWRRVTAERLLARGVDHFAAVSRDLCAHIVNDWGVPRPRVRFVPNGVLLEQYDGLPDRAEARRALGLDPNARVIGTVGAFREVKDFGSLVRAFALLHATRPDTRLVMAGFDPGGRFMARMAREMPEWETLAPAITSLGVRTDIPRILAALDVYVNSSVYEGMSNTILEAMAARRPVVATRVGGTPDIMADGETGWMVPPRDSPALAERIARVIDHPDEGRAMGAAGRRRVETEHSFDAMVAGNVFIYEVAYARKRAPWRATHRARAVAAGIARTGGFLALHRATSSGGLSILTYHNVLPYALTRERPGEAMRVAWGVFEEQIAHLARRYRPIGPAEVLDHLSRKRPFPPHAVWITFDDGYADNFRYAWPVLRDYGVPATIFLATDPIDTGTLLWWDSLTESVQRLAADGSSRFAEVVAPIGGKAGSLLAEAASGSMTVKAAVDGAIAALNEETADERRRVVDVVARAAFPQGGPRAPRLMLTWEEIRAMHAGGVTFGGHGASHAFLDLLPEEEVEGEIVRCLDRIENEIGRRPDLFAYPRGRGDARSRDLLERHGVRLAVTTATGVNRPDADPLTLRRRDAGRLALGVRFSANVFDLEMTGVLDAGRR